MKKATIYQNKKITLIHPYSKTTTGMFIWDHPVVSFPKLVIDEEIVDALFEALDHSKEDVPHPENWKGFFDPVLKKSGEKSIKAFHQNMKNIEVELDQDVLRLIPMRNLGDNQGFQEITSEIVELKQGAYSRGDVAEALNRLTRVIENH